MLNKTASTEGIASKKSLELKKRYLLGENAGNSSVLKSDSASALDTKFKSFASNISECQKLLNPATEISSSMQTFLQRIDRNNELNRSQYSMSLSKSLKDKYNNNNQEEEKENRSIDSNKKQEVTIETVNTALIESKIREMPPEVPSLPEIIETIDLTTPEKKSLPIVDLENVEIPQNTINDNKQFIEDMERSTSSIVTTTNMKIKNKLDNMFIDLTIDSPPKVQNQKSIHEEVSINSNNNKNNINNLNNNSIEIVPDIISNISSCVEKESDENILERPRSPAHETTIEVPQLWSKRKDIETDSLSGSSTSSLDDIPHFILDSTTSPETQNENKNFSSKPPRLEVQDISGELMQIDSLMIINGQYIGDPEDLPLFKRDNNTQPELPSETSLTLTKPLKFDTKNENKLESLKNLPLIVSHEENDVNKSKVSPFVSPIDNDKTPTAINPPKLKTSDSENDDDEEYTTQGGLTETELSDWAADDAVSENFMDIEFALNSGKGTMKRNKKRMHVKKVEKSKEIAAHNENECGILKNLAIEEIDFMDTGSELECNADSVSTTNRALLKNKGYVEFVDNEKLNEEYNSIVTKTPFFVLPKPPPLIEAINTEIVKDVEFIEQGDYILNKYDQKTPINEENLLDSLDIDEDSLLAIDDNKTNESLPTLTTTTETTEELTIVTSPLESLPEFSHKKTQNISQQPILSSLFEKENQIEKEKVTGNAVLCQKHIEESGGYEEYVKSLQMKIAQISNISGRESLEKRSRRKFSTKNGELSSELDLQQNVSGTLPKVETSQMLSKKLEELTKERTKQKDIIHDLVMNKLQAKKQLNAEKRLNRTKNRNLYMSTASPTTSTFALSKSNEKSLAPETSENPQEIKQSPNSKVVKSQSFAFYTNHHHQYDLPKDKNSDYIFKTPIPPPRNRICSDLAMSADKMREDARARAKLKSNEDLGLSPEEKILMLRKKYNLMLSDESQSIIFSNGKNQSDDMKCREKKLAASKSFSDISRLNRQSKEFSLSSSFAKPISEFLSDPNLPDVIAVDNENNVKTSLRNKSNKSSRRDSDRRKSLIQTVSDFFHKKRESSGSTKNLASTTSASKDKLSESSSSTMSVFSRFRLSPKSKDSSKDNKAKVKF